MKIGTILRNDYVRDGNPFRYAIYTGQSGKYANTLYIKDGKIQKRQYYASDIKNREGIIPVGESDVLEKMASLLQEELLKIQEAEKNKKNDLDEEFSLKTPEFSEQTLEEDGLDERE